MLLLRATACTLNLLDRDIEYQVYHLYEQLLHKCILCSGGGEFRKWKLVSNSNFLLCPEMQREAHRPINFENTKCEGDMLEGENAFDKFLSSIRMNMMILISNNCYPDTVIQLFQNNCYNYICKHCIHLYKFKNDIKIKIA